MAQHVKILGVLHLIFGGLSVLGGLLGMAFFGGLAGFVGARQISDPDAVVAVPILGAIGVVIFIVLLLLGLPGILAGWGLLQFRPWARILTIVLSALNLLNVPFGTALGIYGLWVLLSREGELLFENPAASPLAR